MIYLITSLLGLPQYAGSQRHESRFHQTLAFFYKEKCIYYSGYLVEIQAVKFGFLLIFIFNNLFFNIDVPNYS